MAGRAPGDSEADDAAAEECRRAPAQPDQALVFERVLVWGRSRARATRENIKSEAVRWLASIRRSLLLLGRAHRRSADPGARDDVFFLESPRGTLVADRLPGPDWRGSSSRAERGGSNTARDFSSAGRGRDVGRARGLVGRVFGVAHAERDQRELRGGPRPCARVHVRGHRRGGPPGEILVAPFTDPGWTPYFVPAAGIVMDMGGMLSARQHHRARVRHPRRRERGPGDAAHHAPVRRSRSTATRE